MTADALSAPDNRGDWHSWPGRTLSKPSIFNNQGCWTDFRASLTKAAWKRSTWSRRTAEFSVGRRLSSAPSRLVLSSPGSCRSIIFPDCLNSWTQFMPLWREIAIDSGAKPLVPESVQVALVKFMAHERQA